MERLTKILIVIVIVLVAGFSLCVGLLLGNSFDKPAIIMNNTTNQSTAGNNSSSESDNSQTQTQTSDYPISYSQALSILKESGPGDYTYYYQGMSTLPNGHPSYQFTYKASWFNSNNSAAWIEVDAITGGLWT